MLLEVSDHSPASRPAKLKPGKYGQFYIWIFLTRRRTFPVAIVDTTPRVHVRINQFITSHGVDKRIPYETMKMNIEESKIREDGAPSLMHPCFTQFEGRVE